MKNKITASNIRKLQFQKTVEMVDLKIYPWKHRNILRPVWFQSKFYCDIVWYYCNLGFCNNTIVIQKDMNGYVTNHFVWTMFSDNVHKSSCYVAMVTYETWTIKKLIFNNKVLDLDSINSHFDNFNDFYFPKIKLII